MSRWHVIDFDEPNLSVTLAHRCPGAHSPWIVEPFSSLRLPRYDLGERPTFRCSLCAIAGRSEPHLPGPADVRDDAERYVPTRGLALADEMLAEWRRSPGASA